MLLKQSNAATYLVTRSKNINVYVTYYIEVGKFNSNMAFNIHSVYLVSCIPNRDKTYQICTETIKPSKKLAKFLNTLIFFVEKMISTFYPKNIGIFR